MVGKPCPTFILLCFAMNLTLCRKEIIFQIGIYYFFLIGMLGVIHPSQAQSKHQFRHLDLQDGLLDNTVYSILQDTQGFFWFGTSSGLQRYDGYEFVNFKYNPKNPNEGLRENVVRELMEASDGTLWIATEGGGFSRYKDGKLLPAIMKGPDGLSGDIVEAFAEDTLGGVWIGTRQGLDYYYQGEFTRFKHDPDDPNTISDNFIYSLLMDKRGNLWAGTIGGLNLYLGGGKFKCFTHNPLDSNTITQNFIHDIFEDHKGDLWLAIPKGGVCRMHFTSQDTLITRYPYDSQDPSSLSHDIALNITEDQNGNIWIATWGGGLNRFQDGQFEYYRSNYLDPTSISSDYVEEVFVDKDNNLWAVNFMGGVNKYVAQIVETYSYNILKDKGMLPTGSLWDIEIARDSSLWIGFQGGINRYKNGQFEYYDDGNFVQFSEDTGDKLNLSGARITRLFEDSQGRMWACYSDAGMDMWENGQVTHFRYDPNDPEGLPGFIVVAIEEDSYGNIWISCRGQGISQYKDGRFINFKPDPENPNSLHSNLVNDFWPGENGAMWFATRNEGFGYYQDGKFKSYKHDSDDPESLPNNSLRTIVLDKENRVWVGFSGGIARMDRKTEKFTVFTEHDGLPSTYIEELALDADGQIWVVTHNGAARFIPETQSFESFGFKEGFTNPHLKTLKKSPFENKMYFGGKGGFYTIDVEELKSQYKESQALELVFTSFTLYGDTPDSLKWEIQKGFMQGEHTILDYTQNTFDIKFAALSSQIKPVHAYEYRLRKQEDQLSDWIYIGNQSKLSFSYLEPGEYIFELRVLHAGQEGVACTVPITILPPWWQTLWFRVLFVLVFMGGLYSYYQAQLRNVKKQNEKLEQAVEERTLELQEAHNEVMSQAEELQQQAEELSTQRDYLKNTNDELEKINLAIKKKEAQLVQTVEQLESSQKELGRKNQMIEHSIRAAQTIQEAVLPSSQKLFSVMPEHFVIYRPKDIVSGDFYWHTALSIPKDGQLIHYLATVDCTGHGIPGAFMTLIGITLLDKILANSATLKPAEIIERLDQEIRTLLRLGNDIIDYGMDLTLISWEPYADKQSCLTFSGAKSDLYYFKFGETGLHKIKGDRRSLGGFQNQKTPFTNQEIVLPEGSLVYMGTDGYIDQNNAARKSLGRKRFEKLLFSLREKPLKEQQIVLESTLDEYMQNTNQRDDILMMGFRV